MTPDTPYLRLACAAALLALAACSPKTDSASPAAAPVTHAAATVNGVPISEARVDAFLKQRGPAGQAPDARKAVIEGLALQMLAADAAVKKGLDKSPEVADQLDGVRQSVLANAYVEDFVKSHPVGDDAIQAEYDRLKGNMAGTQYKAAHILVDKPSDAADLIATLKKDPKAFAKLAAQKSKDPGSKSRGGDLGWFDARAMVPEFGAALAKMDKGQISAEPVKTQFGYHVILLEDTKPVEPPPLAEVKPQIAQQLQQQGVKKMLDELKAQAKIEIVGAAASAPALAPPAASAASAAK